MYNSIAMPENPGRVDGNRWYSLIGINELADLQPASHLVAPLIRAGIVVDRVP